ncbi:tRNA (N6-threonylcarbamoyladenosine(37)-N6)-methyltransferase TrmO [uncultured Methanoregula sp.]|uniref:tRNA (N6-threonylcarbamoyladenosine(37)-N6)-methyltransferase TrmO n=1 Tax=uncultured Methanoregula sp. TaxID=1005933 RepID=UPI002AAA91E3|nr:tRNA (N6-threonylcarbamoyladenosine(37)-N6)-methyltransferase TrmO [uncultured Methanoregula sp.]
MTIELVPIGTVKSPYKERKDAPRQGRFSDTVSDIIIDDLYLPGLADIEENKHLIVLLWYDRADRSALRATPPHTGIGHGVFATRSPDRPNPVAFSVVDLVGRTGNILQVRGLDALDGTPVIDIKPFLPDIDGIAG